MKSASGWFRLAHDMRSLFTFMEYTENQIIDFILEASYSTGGYIRLVPLVITQRGVAFDMEDCERFAGLLSTLGLCDVSFNQKIPFVKITAKGIEIMQLYNSYSQYLESKKEDKKINVQIKRLTRDNIRLKNLNIVIGIISFIAGILLSSPIKSILKLWLEAD